jgi:DNA-binding YbaB/EbfC family protein
MNINPMELLRNFQNMQAKITEMQEKLKDVSVTGSSGGGMVEVEMNGQLAVTRVTISKEVVNPEDIEMLQDLVLGATADALARVKERLREEASSVTGGMNLPPGMMGI